MTLHEKRQKMREFFGTTWINDLERGNVQPRTEEQKTQNFVNKLNKFFEQHNIPIKEKI